MESFQTIILSAIKVEISKLNRGMEAITDIRETVLALHSEINQIKESINSLKGFTDLSKVVDPKRKNCVEHGNQIVNGVSTSFTGTEFKQQRDKAEYSGNGGSKPI